MQALANTLWAFSKLGYKQLELTNAILTAATASDMRHFNSQNISNIVRSCFLRMNLCSNALAGTIASAHHIAHVATF